MRLSPRSPVGRGRTPSTLDLGPKLAADDDRHDGNSSPIQLPIIHETNSHLRTFNAESRRPCHPSRTTNRRRRTPIQRLHTGRPSSTSSQPAPERSTSEARKSPRGHYSLMPLPPSPRHRRRKPNPNPRPTGTTTPGREEHSGLPHLAKPRGPSELRETVTP